MANEIKLNINATLTNGYLSRSFQTGQLQITQTTLGAYSAVVSVGTSEEDLLTGDVGTLGFLMLRNLDSTNYVQWGPKSGGSMVAVGRLKPNGEPAVIRLEPGITIRWVANTGACKVAVELWEA